MSLLYMLAMALLGLVFSRIGAGEVSNRHRNLMFVVALAMYGVGYLTGVDKTNRLVEEADVQIENSVSTERFPLIWKSI